MDWAGWAARAIELGRRDEHRDRQLLGDQHPRGVRLVQLGFNAAHWQTARVLGPQGMAPWGDVLLRAAATAANSLLVAPGFKVELLRSAAPEEGSWICMAFDPRGRLTIASEGDQRPLLRLSLTDGNVTALERIEAPVRYAMGLLYTAGRLYANARGPAGSVCTSSSMPTATTSSSRAKCAC